VGWGEGAVGRRRQGRMRGGGYGEGCAVDGAVGAKNDEFAG
jgi:hypothetical protein